MRNINIYHVKRRLKNALERIKESEISKKDKDCILEFYEYGFSIGLGGKRILKYLNTLLMLSKWMDKPFRESEKEDIVKVVRKIEMEDYTEWTKKDYKIILKRFYKWLDGNDEEYPKKVKWIKTTYRKNKKKIPEELITREELGKMIKASCFSRDRAFIALLYESGFRIGEILTLQVKDLKFDEMGARIITSGKTGMRKIRIVESIPYLGTWIGNHPFGDDPEAALWIKKGAKKKDNVLQYDSARKVIRTLAKKAGIKKRIYAHLFRHSRATELANHLTDSQMDQYFGWEQGSDMPSTYVHLSGKDIEGKILKLNGLKEENEDDKKIGPKKCKRCDKLNHSTGKFCSRCGSPLDVESIVQLDEKRKKLDDMMSTLMGDPETQRFLVNKMRQLRIEAPVTS